MTTKLNEITYRYHTFVDNQVLTKDQLNEFINYFDDQERMSRVFLHGVGVVCGFKPRVISKSQDILITQGVGITTDGDLVKLRKDIPKIPEKNIDFNDAVYSFYKSFDDDKARYPFFLKTKKSGSTTTQTPIQLWEILEKEDEKTKKLADFPNLNEMVVVLYIENYAKEGELCTAVDCDNQGVEQVNKLRVLLIHKNDVKFLSSADSIFSKYNIIDEYFKLPEIAVKRVVLNALNSKNYGELKRAYFQAISQSQLPGLIKTGLSTIVQRFAKIVDAQITEDEFNRAIVQLRKITGFNAYNVPFDIQYRYDWLKDIVDTYNEIKELLPELKQECNPEINAFPKHLLLGALSEADEPIQHWRHRFYKSPALCCSSSTTEKVKSLIQRIFKIIFAYEKSSGAIKITPSNKLLALSKKAIPFYFDVTPGFLKVWNYDKTRLLKWDTNLCYHTKYLSETPQFQDPLSFSTDGSDFFRIEGHQGKNYKDALAKIDDFKKQYGLAFDVKVLSVNINQSNLNIDDYECEFEDLKVMLLAWKAEQDCVLAEVAKFFSSFSTATPGANEKEPELGQPAKKAPLDEATINPAFAKKTESTGFKQGVTKSGFNQPTYTYNKIVSANLNTNSDTLGFEMRKAIDANKTGSVNDIVAITKANLEGKLNTDLWKENQDIKTFTIDKPLELMAMSHVLSQRMPGSVSMVDTTKVDAYKLSLAQLCDWLKKFKTAYEKVQLNAAVKTFIGTLLNQLAAICCAGKKLEILLDEINKRKESILIRLQLSKFVENHPGLEHKAGVEPGGTFIMVYLSKNTQTKNPLKEARNEIFSENLASNAEIIHQPFETASTPAFTKSISSEINNPGFAGLKTLPRTTIMERIQPEPNLSDNTVVADFALPYMCCSDCAPVNFIVQKMPATMVLETDHYCLGNDTDTIAFEITPADGEVEFDPKVAGIQIEGNVISVVEELFPPEMFGKPIRFTVNKQVTEAVLTVYKGVEFDFDVPSSPTKQTKIDFKPTGDLSGATFLWDFGDGQTSTERNPTVEYKLPVNKENKVVVSLTVVAANGICSKTVQHEIIFIEEKPVVEFTPDIFCENDNSEYNFKITPPGADVTIKGPGVEIKDSGFVFVPSNADSLGEIEFEYSVEPFTTNVKIVPAPQAAFTHKQIGNTLVITNTSANAGKFVWTINGTPKETDKADPIKIELDENSPTRWKVKLRAFGAEVCKPSTTKLETIITKFVAEPTQPTCAELATGLIKTDAGKLKKLNIPTNTFVAPVWRMTANLYGGNSTFNKGVINDIDNFLSGQNNGQLIELFTELIQTTVTNIVEIDRKTQKTAFNRLVRIFELQLNLFYNILGCQSPEAIEKAADSINAVFSLIIDRLMLLKEMKVVMPKTLRLFMQKYASKVADQPLILDHLNEIKSNKLI